MRKPNCWDVLKVYGIVFVVVGHTNFPLNSVLYFWHMPLFFFVGGVLFSVDRRCSVAVGESFNRLVVPWAIFLTLGFIVEALKRWGLGRDPFVFSDLFLGSFVFQTSSTIIGYGFVLWFLLALFWCRVFSSLAHSVGWLGRLLLFLLYIVSLYFVDEVIYPLALSQAVLSLPFFVIGLLYRHLVGLGAGSIPFSVFFLAAAGHLFAWWSVLMWAPGVVVDFGNANVSDWFAYLYSVAFLLTAYFLSVGVSQYLPRFLYGFVLAVSNASLFIMVFHPYTNNLADSILGAYGWFSVLLLSLIGLLIWYFIYERVKRVLPFSPI